MSLRDVFENIVRNEYIREGIKEVISGSQNSNFIPRNQPKYDAYKAFVVYQMEQYAKLYATQHPTLSPAQALWLEGFQGGVPWVGDIENASVLFLSSNPAFTPNQCTPRYHAYEDNWTIYTADGNNNVQMKSIELQDVCNFYTYPLSKEKNPIGRLMKINHPNTNPRLTVRILEDNTIGPKKRGVKFWNDLTIEILVHLLLNEPNKKLTKDDLITLIEKTVFTEIVPFQSMEQHGVDDALDFCWKDFSKKILCYSKARLWIIVGSHARGTLSRIMQNDGGNVFSNVERFQNGEWGQVQNGNIQPLNIGDIFRLDYNKLRRTLWVIPHPNAGRKKEDLTLDKFLKDPKYVSPNHWDNLKKSIKS